MKYQKKNPAANRACKNHIHKGNSSNINRRKQVCSFAGINTAALAVLPSLLARWLPDGRMNGQEYTARNPKRADRRAGSFKVNVRTGKWADFATGDKGGDIISLAAYLSGKRQGEAARELSRMLGVEL